MISQKPWYKLADLELSQPFGWIDQEGLYYSCDYTEHINTMYELQELGMLSDATDKEFEENLVKVTETWEGEPIIITCQKVLTARQKLTIEKLINKHDLLDERVKSACHLVGDQTIYLEDGKVKFEKRTAHELD